MKNTQDIVQSGIRFITAVITENTVYTNILMDMNPQRLSQKAI